MGDIDPRFGISREDFAASLATAAKVWNTAEGRTLIYESSTSTLPVSLIYDTRQATVALGSDISSEQAAYNLQKKVVDTKRSALNTAQAVYDRARTSFEAQAQAHTPVPVQAGDVTALTAAPPPLVALPMAERPKVSGRKRKQLDTPVPAAAQTTGARPPVRRRPLAAVQVTAGT
jgi:pyruvate/2-oxoacid:ferredoxin oxidoreductase alpha subunit